MVLGTISQILTVLVGTTAFGALVDQVGSSNGQPWPFYTLACISILAAIFAAVTKFLNYFPLAEAHATARRKYGKITSQFESILAGNSLVECMQFIIDKMPDYSDIIEDAPPIPEKIWLRAGQEAEDKGKDVTEGVFRRVACKVELSDDFLYSETGMGAMEEERKWKYTVAKAEIKFFHKHMELSFEVEISHPSSRASEIYQCKGMGPLYNSVGCITYSFTSQDGSTQWNGVMLLRLPSRGDISGLWMATNVNEDGKIPVGKIALQRLVTAEQVSTVN
jgi:hypothetical protein